VWGSSGPVAHWDFAGNVVVTNDYIRLTPDRQSRRGWLWNKEPVLMPAWEVEFEFSVHGQGRHTYGDGFAFWYTEQSMRQGANHGVDIGEGTVLSHGKRSGPAYGNIMNFKGLGIIFDTFDNDKNVRAICSQSRHAHRDRDRGKTRWWSLQ
jgi:mannose-binding lectin 2